MSEGFELWLEAGDELSELQNLHSLTISGACIYVQSERFVYGMTNTDLQLHHVHAVLNIAGIILMCKDSRLVSGVPMPPWQQQAWGLLGQQAYRRQPLLYLTPPAQPPALADMLLPISHLLSLPPPKTHIHTHPSTFTMHTNIGFLLFSLHRRWRVHCSNS